MFNYLRGKVSIINPMYIVIDINGIGYEINVSNPYSFKIDDDLTIYTYQHVKEDELSLYGFKKKEEKDLFLNLISVKGIGPKTALVILAATNINEFKSAVVSNDITYLTKFPKIGKKSAQQIVLDLQNKFKNDVNIDVNNINNSDQEEVVEALVALGYDKKAIKNTYKKVDATLKIEEQIKECLKLLIKI